MLVASACPAALLPQPSIKKSAGLIVDGITAVWGMRDDPAVAAAVDHWGQTLELVARMLKVLAALKGLHDCLHRLQLQQLRRFRDLVRRFATDPDSLSDMLTSLDVIRQAVRDARAAAADLPATPADRGVELEWIARLDGLATVLGPALEELDTRAAIGAMTDFRQIIRGELVRLNSRMVVTVEAVPLAGLIAAMEEIDRATTDTPGAIPGGLAALRQLYAALSGRVAEHRQWQNADNKLWALEEVIDQAPATLMDDVRDYLWPNAAEAVEPLCQLDPFADWSVAIGIESGRVGVALAAVDLTNLRLALQRHRSQSRFRFFDVDRMLYAECGEAARIAPPLTTLVAAVDAD